MQWIIHTGQKEYSLNPALHIHVSSGIGFSIIFFSKKDVSNLTLAPCSLGSLKKKKKKRL